jgi:tRNA uridine 5-carboxymethylaminomethyl modification enzyme
LRSRGLVTMMKSLTLEEFLRRTDVTPQVVADLGFQMSLDPLVFEAVEIDVKYAGYVKRQRELIEQSKKFELMLLPEDLAYSEIRGLSNEERDKLLKVRPRTLGQAQRISGVNPSAIQAIMVHLKKENSFESASRSISPKPVETGNMV